MKKKFCIFNPCFYMLISVLSGELASLMCGFAPRLAYSIFSALIPIVIYLKNSGEKIRIKTDTITFKIPIIAILLWAGGNLLNSGVNLGLSKIGITVISQLESETDTYKTVMNIIVTCVVAPICEEFTYRGIILKSAYVYGKNTAVLVSAMLFALAHGSITIFVMPFIYGIICGICAVKTDSIAPGILIHCICNTLSYVFTKFNVPWAFYVVLPLGAACILCLAVLTVKNIKLVILSIRGFLYNMDFWWIPVFVKTLLSNIIYHGG